LYYIDQSKREQIIKISALSDVYNLNFSIHQHQARPNGTRYIKIL